jgi:hypothetical protein
MYIVQRSKWLNLEQMFWTSNLHAKIAGCTSSNLKLSMEIKSI